MEQVSSLNSTAPSFQANSKAAESMEKPEYQSKKDGNKKLLLALGGLAAIGAGALICHKKFGSKAQDEAAKCVNDIKDAFSNKTGTIEEQGKRLLDAADDVTRRAQGEASDMMSAKSRADVLKAQAGKLEGDCDIRDGKKIFTRTIQGKEMTVAADEAGNLLSIQEIADGGKRIRYNFGEDGSLRCIREGLETVTDESGKKIKSAGKVYDYKNGGVYNNLTAKASPEGAFNQPVSYDEFFEYANRENPADGVLKGYTNAFSFNSKGASSVAGMIDFKDGKAAKISTGTHMLEKPIDDVLIFDERSFEYNKNGELVSAPVMKELVQEDGKEIIKTTNYIFKDGNWIPKE